MSDFINFIPEDEMLKSKKDRLEKWDKVSKIILRFVVCVAAMAVAITVSMSKLHDMRYIVTTQNGEDFSYTRIIDTWEDKQTWYFTHRDFKTRAWEYYKVQNTYQDN